MPQIAYVNGRYVPRHLADISMMDRAAQFGDGVYDVMLLQRGRFFDEQPHIDRLWRSMGELDIAPPCSKAVMKHIMRELVRRNRLHEGGVYVQVSRGVAMRKHEYVADLPSFLTAFLVPSKPKPRDAWLQGFEAVYYPDERWARCDIKSTSLITNVMARQKATAQGAAEALFVRDDGVVSEGALSNLCVIRADGVLQTHPLSRHILPGITRAAVLGLAREAEVAVEEKPFTKAELEQAKEVFVTSTIAKIVPLVLLEGANIGTGRTGNVTMKLADAYEQKILHEISKLS